MPYPATATKRGDARDLHPQVRTSGTLGPSRAFLLDAMITLASQRYTIAAYGGTLDSRYPTGLDAWLDSVGLLWADGIEPAGNENTLYPVGGSNRVWYINANAGSNGDGSSGSPYWAFTEINAGTAPGYAAGDHLYLTGDFTHTKHNAGVRDMGLSITSAAWLGTTTNPTVIRSWPGQARAKIDGEYATTNPVSMSVQPSSTAATKGLVYINLQVTRCVPGGIICYAGGGGTIGLLRFVSNWVHFNYSPQTGPNAAYGGILLQARATGCDVKGYNNKIHDNRSPDGVTLSTNNNSGGVDWHTGIDSTSATIEWYYNEIFNEYRAFGNKWSGVATIECHHNHIYDCTTAHFVRNALDNYIHHELIEDCATFIQVDDENRNIQADIARTVRWNNCTIVGATLEFSWDDGGQTVAYADVTRGFNNIVSNAAKTTRHLTFEQYSATSFATAGLQYYDNCIYMDNATTFAMVNSSALSKASFIATYDDGASVYADPLFGDAGAGNYALLGGSPAASINGVKAGAF